MKFKEASEHQGDKIGDTKSAEQIEWYVQENHVREDWEETNLPERIQKFQTFTLKEIPLESFDTEEFNYDLDWVEDEAKRIRDQGTYEPIVLGMWKNDLTHKGIPRYYIIDGTHRANAIKLLKRKTILAWVGNIQ